MLTLVFDTETTGFPSRGSPITDQRQPYLVQLAVLLAEGESLLERWDSVVSCPVEIPEAASKVHGITTERSRAEGISNDEAVRIFDLLVKRANRLICHNTIFDMQIMRIAYARAGQNFTAVSELPQFCTMKTISDDARRRGQRSHWPKLDVAYRKLVDPAGFSAAHTADADALACWEVLLALEAKGAQLHQLERV